MNLASPAPRLLSIFLNPTSNSKDRDYNRGEKLKKSKEAHLIQMEEEAVLRRNFKTRLTPAPSHYHQLRFAVFSDLCFTLIGTTN
ncbi:hypothetical protein L2E82_29541 [Cichorium intybus]|uniref:Uncharacterized protein n=1 Tax=Cichorium intybus TaxID=13427 RepID=A0ACB9CY80_CICIN|nr:hypothetical protein L2E82_29541 [Cichorium intybus]